MDNDDLQPLIRKAQAGDLESYGRLVRRFQDMTIGYAYAILGDFHLAQDAAQEAFREAFRQLPRLRQPRAFAAWLRKIVFKYCDRQRRTRRERIISPDRLPTTPAPVEVNLETRETHEQVLQALAGLPKPQRTVTALYYINGYSQPDIAGFLDVPLTTVKKRLHDAKHRLKERMLTMVEATLKHNAPDDRFSRQVIEKLLSRPKPLEIEGHPVQMVWQRIREVLPDFEVVTGREIEDRRIFNVVKENMDRAYQLDEMRALRTQMTISTLRALEGRQPPVRMIAPGRVFRPDAEDETHLNVFHQVDGLCIEPDAGVEKLKAILHRLLGTILGDIELRWEANDCGGFVEEGYEVYVRLAGRWSDIAGCGKLRPETLREAGFASPHTPAIAFGMGLERLAMLKYNITDMRKLWQPPYIPDHTKK